MQDHDDTANRMMPAAANKQMQPADQQHKRRGARDRSRWPDLERRDAQPVEYIMAQRGISPLGAPRSERRRQAKSERLKQRALERERRLKEIRDGLGR